METRALGRTGFTVSVLGFGCGAVGGLMVRGEPAEQERAVARAVERGIRYFDTAASYGAGRSETNLGRVLAALKPDIVLGTKFNVDGAADPAALEAGIVASLEASLRRLGRDRVDLFQLHNPIAARAGDGRVTLATVLDVVIPALERLRDAGKIRAFGFTAVGETDGLHGLMAHGAMRTAQVSYNLLNPSAATPVPVGYPAQDYGGLLTRAAELGVGVIGIRALAGGALSATEARHPLGSPPPEPIGSGGSYAADVRRAKTLLPLVDEGYARSLTEAALRFVISNPAVATTLVGLSSLDQLDAALDAADLGPLPPAALTRAAELRAGFVGEPR